MNAFISSLVVYLMASLAARSAFTNGLLAGTTHNWRRCSIRPVVYGHEEYGLGLRNFAIVEDHG